MTQALTTFKTGWTEHTASPTLNTSIGITKLLSSCAVSYLAIQKFPRLGLMGGIAISFLETPDLICNVDDWWAPTDLQNMWLVDTGLLAIVRGIQLITLGSLLKVIGSTLYYREVTLWVGIGKVGGSLLAGAVIGACPTATIIEMSSCRFFSLSDKILNRLGVRHSWDVHRRL